MKFIDMHCDTLAVAYFRHKPDVSALPGAMLDVKRMKAGGAMAQFFAIYMFPPGAEKYMGLADPIDDVEYVNTSLDIFHATMKNCAEDIAPAYSGDDVERNWRAGKMSGLLTFEDGRMIDGSLENLDYYYKKGIRLISLTWNQENCFGYPNSKDPAVMRQGLKKFGKDAVARMNELGILVDVSHLSDGGFWDVVEVSKKPFVASHSNSRDICPHVRNLTAEMIKALADKGGVAGINYGPEFIHPDKEKGRSDLEIMGRQIRELIKQGGVDCVALGSDFDGIEGDVEISSVDKVPLLFDYLHDLGLSDDDIEKIAWKNVMRVMREVLD